MKLFILASSLISMAAFAVDPCESELSRFEGRNKFAAEVVSYFSQNSDALWFRGNPVSISDLSGQAGIDASLWRMQEDTVGSALVTAWIDRIGRNSEQTVIKLITGDAKSKKIQIYNYGGTYLLARGSQLSSGQLLLSVVEQEDEELLAAVRSITKGLRGYSVIAAKIVGDGIVKILVIQQSGPRDPLPSTLSYKGKSYQLVLRSIGAQG